MCPVYKCSYCSESFPTEDAKVSHETNESSLPQDGKFQCETCDVCFDRYNCLQLHIDTAHSEDLTETPSATSEHKVSDCQTDDECDVVMSNSDEDADNDTFPCDMCSVVLTDFDEYSEHLAGHFSGNNHTCPVCSEGFSTGKKLREHQLTHDDVVVKIEMYECQICCEKFALSSELDAHAIVHSSEMYPRRRVRPKPVPVDCPVCSKQLASKASLKKHIMDQHEMPDCRPFSCEHCLKTFKNDVNRKEHLRTHDKLRYPCDVCGKEFRDQKMLKRHVQGLHSEVFRCDICGKSSPRASWLKMHKAIHVRERALLQKMADRAQAQD